MTSSAADARSAQDRGRSAQSPGDVPAAGWRDVLARVRVKATADQVTLLAAGVAFFLLLSLVPTLIAAVSVYGLVADPADVRRQVEELAGGLPGSAQDLVVEQVRAVTERSAAGLTLSAVLAVVVALWSASSGVRHLIEALNVAYDEEESRGPVRRYGQALILAAVAVVGGAMAVGLIAVVPAALDATGLGDAASTLLSVLRWPLLAAMFGLAVGVLYRTGPDRDAPRAAWVTWGSAIATVLWLAASVAFSVYADMFASFDSYGSLAGVIVLMLWLQISAAVVLLGAEVNCELERQTLRDPTVGPTDPIGRRGAHAADTVGASAEQVDSRR